jgi:hypothetical protein
VYRTLGCSCQGLVMGCKFIEGKEAVKPQDA